MPPPIPPQCAHPTITGTTVGPLAPGDVVVMKVLEVHSILVAASVEKFDGGVFIVDAMAAASEEAVGVACRTSPPMSGLFDTEADGAF